MKFTCNTKPLVEALNLGVINANVSKFHSKSCLAQITATRDLLKINLEASYVVSEIRIKGHGDTDECCTVFVNNLLLKQLVSTMETSTVTLEFDSSGLILHSGKSKFTLPKMVEGEEFELQVPDTSATISSTTKIDKGDWKFIQDHQMYALAMSFVHPVYTRVWVSQNGDVLVGDIDVSLFTHSNRSKLGQTCLLSDTIINLFNSLPEGAELMTVGSMYMIRVNTDSYEYIVQFRPQYESDEDVGSYNSEIILSILEHPAKYMQLSARILDKYLSQSMLLSNSNDAFIKLSVDNSGVRLQDSNVDCLIEASGSLDTAYSLEFKTTSLRLAISKYGDCDICISPSMQDDEVVGLVIWNDEFTTVLAGVD